MSVITLAPLERSELERLARSRSLVLEPARRRAKVILMLSTGGSYSAIRKRLGCSVEYISYWRARFNEKRLIGLSSQYPRGSRGQKIAQVEARILDWTGREPTDGSTHWSTHRLAKEVGACQSTVSRVWRKFGIQPPRWPVCLASDEPGFAEKAADIIGLYIRLSMHCAVFCVDQKSAIQALDLLDSASPFSSGRVGGVFSLYSALSSQSEDALAGRRTCHRRTDFVDFLAQIVMGQAAGREIHLIAENMSKEKTGIFFEFLAANPAVRTHYAPTYSNWINQIAIWFSKIHRDAISRGAFTSVKGFRA